MTNYLKKDRVMTVGIPSSIHVHQTKISKKVLENTKPKKIQIEFSSVKGKFGYGNNNSFVNNKNKPVPCKQKKTGDMDKKTDSFTGEHPYAEGFYGFEVDGCDEDPMDKIWKEEQRFIRKLEEDDDLELVMQPDDNDYIDPDEIDPDEYCYYDGNDGSEMSEWIDGTEVSERIDGTEGNDGHVK